MLNVHILAVGKCRERFYADACAEYAKRLSAFCRLQISEVEEYRLPSRPSAAEIEKCLKAEGRALIALLPPKAFAVALCVEGHHLTSPEFSSRIESLSATSSSLYFLIGGSHGLSEEAKSVAGARLSFSDMTFPHQLARVVLLEQVYRAFCIMQNRQYHK